MIMHMNSSQSLLRVLVYFDLFDYPVTREEIGLFMDKCVSGPELDHTLNDLVDSGIVIPYKTYYSLKSPAALVKRREAGNQLADTLLPTALKISSFLYQFPFVRGIGI